MQSFGGRLTVKHPLGRHRRWKVLSWILENRSWAFQMDGTGSGTCTVAYFSTVGFEPSGCWTTMSVSL